MLHEAYIGAYSRDMDRLFGALSTLHAGLSPDYVMHGIVDKGEPLSTEDLERLMEFQEQLIGHAHNPAQDYLSFETDLLPFMKSEGYKLTATGSSSIPVPGCEESPWRHTIGMFKISP